MTGGKTAGISLMQRTLLTGKATLKIQGGTVGAIYAGSFYNDEECASQTGNWNGWGTGWVNYGQAAAIDITIGKGVSYSNIYKGFQYLDKDILCHEVPHRGRQHQTCGFRDCASDPIPGQRAHRQPRRQGTAYRQRHGASDSYITTRWVASDVALDATSATLAGGR